MTKSADSLLSDILARADKLQPFIKQHGEAVWTSLRDAVGRREAMELISLPRNEIFVQLRVRYGLTLQQVGDIFNLTRERIRQLTPSGLWHKDSPEVDWEAIAQRVAQAAARDPSAWNKQGRLRSKWATKNFGEDVAINVHRYMNKLQIILRYKFGLETEDKQLDWLRDKYFSEERSYQDIAKMLSKSGLSISTMCVYRNMQELGIQGYSVGRPGGSRP